jgi:hypothetical protein
MSGGYPAVTVQYNTTAGLMSNVTTWSTFATAALRGPIRTQYGRSKDAYEMEPGSFTLTLDPNSAGFPSTLTLGHRIQIYARPPGGSTDMYLAYGWIDHIQHIWRDDNIYLWQVRCIDALGLLARIDMPESSWAAEVLGYQDYGVGVDELQAWYRPGLDKDSKLTDWSANGRHGDYQGYEDLQNIFTGTPLTPAILEGARRDPIAPGTDVASLSWAALYQEIGQPPGSYTGVPRTPAVALPVSLYGTLNSSFTFIAWIQSYLAKPVDVRATAAHFASQTILSFWNVSATNIIHIDLGIRGDGVAMFRKYDLDLSTGTFSSTSLVSSVNVADGQPHMIAWVRDSSVDSIVVDATTSTSTAGLRPLPVCNDNPRVNRVTTDADGLSHGYDAMQCHVQEMVLIGDNLVLGQIESLYNAGKYGCAAYTRFPKTWEAIPVALSQAKCFLTLDNDTSGGLSVNPGVISGVGDKYSTKKAMTHLADIARSDGGWFWQKPNGTLMYRGRSSFATYGTTWNFNGDILTDSPGFSQSVGSTLDKVEVSFLSRDNSKTAVSERTPTGGATLSIDSLLTNVTDAGILAGFWMGERAVAELRADDSLRMEPSSDVEWEIALEVAYGDTAIIDRDPINTIRRITFVSHDIDPGQGRWVTTIGTE